MGRTPPDCEDRNQQSHPRERSSGQLRTARMDLRDLYTTSINSCVGIQAQTSGDVPLYGVLYESRPSAVVN